MTHINSINASVVPNQQIKVTNNDDGIIQRLDLGKYIDKVKGAGNDFIKSKIFGGGVKNNSKSKIIVVGGKNQARIMKPGEKTKDGTDDDLVVVRHNVNGEIEFHAYPIPGGTTVNVTNDGWMDQVVIESVKPGANKVADGQDYSAGDKLKSVAIFDANGKLLSYTQDERGEYIGKYKPRVRNGISEQIKRF